MRSSDCFRPRGGHFVKPPDTLARPAQRSINRSLHPSTETGQLQSDWLLGGALDVRMPVSQGHGAVRAELRYDRLNNSNDSDFSTNSIGVQMGIDLLFK